MKNKKSGQKSLALAGLMTSINILIILLSSFQFTYIFSDLLLTLFFPLVTTFTFLLCEKKAAFCYFIVSLIICFFIQFEKTIFYLFPSLISGLLFALFIQKHWNYLYAVIFVGILNSFMMALLFFVGEKLFSVPFYQAFQTIFQLEEQQAKEAFPLFIAISSFAQTLINAYIIYHELPKYEIEIHFDTQPVLYLFYASLLFSLLSFIFMFFHTGTSMFFFGISLPSIFFSLVYIIRKKKWWVLILSSLFLVFGFAIFSTLLPNYGFLGLSCWGLIMDILGIAFFQKSDSFFMKE